ncbi:hypothetical protein QRO08_16770 [Paracidovorax citrulli]|uniref:ABC transporter permease n=1 Tax=Paracidovorax citrulli TaxID=80869 RepID=A0ABY9AL84_PARCI|nr:hypothetical protein [Paracidovorax citrulli]PVY66381.1 hypothetical protein C8E08_3788 [Paracidovorax citrulli]REG69448.1 hypothetical protein C8E07_2599 [Paracidovorax citrulli]RLJ94002.1 hypothetical protein C8E06_2598 [Paracidovorax citrulli]UMT84144.1 hypothetical protein FRC75_12645 [Paracidovorax citrulli]WIY27928.1 hypothetical protein QRO09_12650 [Paracidovorax citrulli]
MSAPIQVFGPYRSSHGRRARRVRRAAARVRPVLAWLVAVLLAFALPAFVAGLLSGRFAAL